jgi:hypothetical protein
MSQLGLFSGPVPPTTQARTDPGDAAEGVRYPDGWSPHELPEPAATAVREEPALAYLAAAMTVHRLHGEDRPLVTRGRRAGLAYLEQRALQRALARVAAARQITAGEGAGDGKRGAT